MDIDDAHVDHIERFVDGGKTTIKNAQLTHRYCNLQKG
ncbi:MAG: HNH endonuclease [Thaumarchaeota archaeon]|nr:HNH endonuclease [Nitrososphaerota archaeon]